MGEVTRGSGLAPEGRVLIVGDVHVFVGVMSCRRLLAV